MRSHQQRREHAKGFEIGRWDGLIDAPHAPVGSDSYRVGYEDGRKKGLAIRNSIIEQAVGRIRKHD